MRHTRNRQLYKLTGDNHWHDTYNVPIELNRKWAPLGLDPTFKWHRNYGEYWFSHISYGDKDSQYPFWCEIVHIKDWKDKEDKRRCE